MATRRGTDGMRWDHGAQFATFHNEEIQNRLRAWNIWDHLQPWHCAHAGAATRYIHAAGINGLATGLATGLSILRSERIEWISGTKDGWSVQTQTQRFNADVLLLTFPIPQTVDLFRTARLTITPSLLAELEGVRYHPCYTLLAELEDPCPLLPYGLLEPRPHSDLRWICNNQSKGISSGNTITAHSTYAYATLEMDADRDAVHQHLHHRLEQELGQRIRSSTLHFWRYAEGVTPLSGSHRFTTDPAPLALAGDIFAADAGPSRVERAMLSGLQAARALQHQLNLPV